MSELTPAFWKWFEGSQVVDRHGQPRVVWHGSHFAKWSRFHKFKTPSYFADRREYAEQFANEPAEEHLYPCYLSIKNPCDLTPFGARSITILDFFDILYARGVRVPEGADRQASERLGHKIQPVWAFIIDIMRRTEVLPQMDIVRLIRDAGYDGIVMIEKTRRKYGKGDGIEKTRAWVAFEPSQIKLADGGNDGSFDANDPDIRSNPMTLRLYHVTLAENLPKIQKQGIKPQKKSLWTGSLGQKLSKEGAIYAFDVFDDAARWAFKTEFDTQKPVAILEFEPHPTSWIQDQHWQGQMGKGWWLMSYRPVKPAEIKYVIELDDKIRKALVKTLGADTQVMPDGKIVPFAGKSNLW